MFGIRVDVEWDHRPKFKDKDVKTHIYRIIQEAVNNAIRHGKAQQVVIRLRRDSYRLCLTITDNGVGLPKGIKPNRGAGLRNMRHRARIIGAVLGIARAGNNQDGTIVTCTFYSPSEYL